ncbi:hypothetical protein BB547_26260, partial [Escherichia coli]
GSVGLVRQDPTSRVVSVAAASGGTSVDLTGTDGVRTLTGVRDGTLAADSSEAVTGSQLFTTNQNVTTNTAAIATNTGTLTTQGQTLTQHTGQLSGLTQSLGGGAAIATDGSFTAPTYQIQGSGRSTVGDALTALDTSVTANTGNITTLQNDVNNISSGSVGLVRQDPTSRVVSVAAASGGTSVDLTGTDGVRTLTGVRD